MNKINEAVTLEKTKKIDITNGENECQEGNEEKSPLHSPDEFKITVRKLEMPVRPRGVLAE